MLLFSRDLISQVREHYVPASAAARSISRGVHNLPIPKYMQTAAITVPIRWLVISALFLVAVAAIYCLCHVAGGVDSVIGITRRITYGALFAVGYWSASQLLQKWMSGPTRPAVPTIAPAPPLPTFATVPPPSGPGQYRVRGVDQDTRFETTEVVFADSPSNAQLKVELKGVRVAAVERAG